MEAYESVATKLDVREFAPKKVPGEIKSKILEAARLAQSGNNSQHWRFVLVQAPENLSTLAKDSSWGKWVENAGFAIIVLTDPKLSYHMIDAGRVVQSMQIAAWGLGVVSCVFTGFGSNAFRKDFAVPGNLEATIVVGFGYPAKKLLGKKNRKPLSELVSLEKYGNKFDRGSLA